MSEVHNIKAIHPFPARMAPSIVWESLPDARVPMRVLDPMAGSGTTLAVARSKGHMAFGIDRDPLAVTIARAWCSNIEPALLRRKAVEVLDKAKKTVSSVNTETAFPAGSDDDTRAFVKFWFDTPNRKQLTALSKHIALTGDDALRPFLWTAFSRMIITKKRGVSLAMDVSHSRPHRAYLVSPVKAFDIFLMQVERVIRACPFAGLSQLQPPAIMRAGDSRSLPYSDGSFDMVITSPPYLNAIDYMRGHKLSLVWLGNTTRHLMQLRSTNIGAEVKADLADSPHLLKAAYAGLGREKLAAREEGFVARYIRDMSMVCAEVARVLKVGGSVTYVTGDSCIKGSMVYNSRIVEALSRHYGLERVERRTRPLAEGSRYLPPPSHHKAGKELQARMRHEVILTMSKR